MEKENEPDEIKDQETQRQGGFPKTTLSPLEEGLMAAILRGPSFPTSLRRK